jgi:anti-sigma regulatory factor (Ser/Thr protein kinase)
MTRTRRFSCEPESVAAARRFATHPLKGASNDAISAVELMVSELATNCVRHARAPFDLTVAQERGTIRVEVTDCAGGTPRMRTPAPDDPTGRGLQIVDIFSERWGVELAAAVGKTVWFTISSQAAEPSGVAGR